MTSRANETEAKFTGTYDTGFVRQLWAYCYNAALRKRMHPAASTAYCDCMIDTVRQDYTREKLDSMTNREEVFTGIAEMCGVKLFGPAPTGVPESLTHARKLPIGSNRWLESLFISHKLFNPVIARLQRWKS